jgi:hypothetical protein
MFLSGLSLFVCRISPSKILPMPPEARHRTCRYWIVLSEGDFSLCRVCVTGLGLVCSSLLWLGEPLSSQRKCTIISIM